MRRPKKLPHVYRRRTLAVLDGGNRLSPENDSWDWLDYPLGDPPAIVNALLTSGVTEGEMASRSTRQGGLSSHVSTIRKYLEGEPLTLPAARGTVVNVGGRYRFSRENILALEPGWATHAATNPAQPTALSGAAGGTGFGESLQTRHIEQAAVAAVRRLYPPPDWEVVSVENQPGLGHDLVCRRGPVVEHVEVKGVAGAEQQVIMRASQERAARTDPHHVIYIVTAALTSNLQVFRYSGADFLKQFVLTPISYVATRRLS